MNERNVSERIVRAVDARLSGLTGDPWMAKHVLARAEEELLSLIHNYQPTTLDVI